MKKRGLSLLYTKYSYRNTSLLILIPALVCIPVDRVDLRLPMRIPHYQTLQPSFQILQLIPIIWLLSSSLLLGVHVIRQQIGGPQSGCLAPDIRIAKDEMDESEMVRFAYA